MTADEAKQRVLERCPYGCIFGDGLECMNCANTNRQYARKCPGALDCLGCSECESLPTHPSTEESGEPDCGKTIHPDLAIDKAEVVAWLKDRMLNARRIAGTKHGDDKHGWNEDALFFESAIHHIASETSDYLRGKLEGLNEVQEMRILLREAAYEFNQIGYCETLQKKIGERLSVK